MVARSSAARDRTRQGVLLLLVGCLVLLAGCGRETQRSQRPLVIVSVLPQAYFVERLAGDLVDVEVMIPPGASPATYEPTMRQMKLVDRADLYVKLGHSHFPFEAVWLPRLLAGKDGLKLVPSAEGVGCEDEDPHVWVSPANVRVMARNIAAGLAPLLADHADALRENLEAFEAEIDAVDAELRSTLAPYRGAPFMVFHPAWGCLARDYGLEQVAIEHHAKEPSPHELAQLIDRGRAENVRVIFVQPQFSKRSAEQVARELGAVVREADPLARDWPSSLRTFAAELVGALQPLPDEAGQP